MLFLVANPIHRSLAAGNTACPLTGRLGLQPISTGFFLYLRAVFVFFCFFGSPILVSFLTVFFVFLFFFLFIPFLFLIDFLFFQNF
jgi:hypothetical protein